MLKNNRFSKTSVRHLRHTKLKNKIVGVFLSVFCINALVMSCLFYHYAKQDMMANYRESASSMVIQIETQLSKQFESIKQKVGALRTDLSFSLPMQRFLVNRDQSIDPVLLGEVANKLTQVQMSDDSIYAIYIYTEKGMFDNYIFARNAEADFRKTPMYQYFETYPAHNSGYLQALQSQMFIDDEVVIPIIYKETFNQQDIIYVVNLSQHYLKDYFDRNYAFFEKVFIVDREGRDVMYFDTSYQTIIDEMQGVMVDDKVQYQELLYKGEAYSVVSIRMAESGYTIYGMNPINTLTKHLRKSQWIIILGVSVCVLISCSLIIYLTKAITRPLEALAEHMDSDRGLEAYTLDYAYNDEIGRLSKSYGKMMAKIETLVTTLNEKIIELEAEKERVASVQAQKRQAELRALKAQIKPHFLYNTLNTITWQAEAIDADDISLLASTLGKFFRISLSKGRGEITLEEEIQHVTSYLIIQKIRYTTRVNYSIDIAQEIAACYIINLILQPLVENAIYHGVKAQKESIHIDITAHIVNQGNSSSMHIYVVDDGAGIERTKLDYINTCLAIGKTDSATGYGIYNVNERIKLSYGAMYGLTLESEEGRGTKVIIHLPIQQQPKEE